MAKRRVRQGQRRLRRPFGTRKGDRAFLSATSFNVDGFFLVAVVIGVHGPQIVRRAAQFCFLGFAQAESEQGNGYMTEAVNTVIPFAFDHLRLHRVEAACLPSNVASIRLLGRCGFSEEGLARRYLKINGRWEDHLLFGLLASDHGDEHE